MRRSGRQSTWSSDKENLTSSPHSHLPSDPHYPPASPTGPRRETPWPLILTCETQERKCKVVYENQTCDQLWDIFFLNIIFHFFNGCVVMDKLHFTALNIIFYFTTTLLLISIDIHTTVFLYNHQTKTKCQGGFSLSHHVSFIFSGHVWPFGYNVDWPQSLRHYNLFRKTKAWDTWKSGAAWPDQVHAVLLREYITA